MADDTRQDSDPPPFRQGEEISRIRPKLESLRKLVKARRVMPSGDIGVKESASGTTLFFKRGKGLAAGTSAELYPWDAVIGTANSVSTLTFIPGTINNFFPANMVETATNTLAATGLYYCYVACTTTNAAVTNATVTVSTSAPTPIATTITTPPSSFNAIFGVIIDRVWYRTIPTSVSNMNATPTQSFVTDKASLDPGILPYNIWWTWAVT
jgi:hypothetical protein